MAIITDYATLQQAIADYLTRDDLLGFIPNFIQNCENKLYRRLNLRNEEAALNVDILSGVAVVPSDFKALKFAYFDDTFAEQLHWVPLNELYLDYPNRNEAQIPSVISREATNFVFGPSSKDGTLRGVYYAKPASVRTGTSWYVENAPEVLLYGALLESAPFIRDDERLITWGNLFRDAVESIEEEQRNAETSMGPIRQRAS
ncbi:MAG: hypothetical protein AAGE92_00045 [Cyanobacteria bacterium P01_G01_bin.4]